ncbi:orgamic radical activating enzyme [Vibrio phage VpKK5]|uniref:QueE-like radical SAM domain n=1 Tax=Vibrio phage VpKK5 TaxID=1538804 RepID=UPI0004F89C4E|nr:QueE-like radical SAM domain [Vibrio phage VpKK5]AIM40614.1 orgamic radical activating enzyme [Vibrio phage VpKK5]
MIKNHQPKEPQSLIFSEVLDVHSIFFTIQGEGIFAGHPAVFIRLAGCNLQCPACDTEYTEGRQKLAVPTIVSAVRDASPRQDSLPIVVISGGEPFRQNITLLVKTLLEHGFQVQIETNGTAYVDGFPYEDVTIMCSPKIGSVHRSLRPHVDAYKYVISHDAVSGIDGLPTSVLATDSGGKVARPQPDFKGKIYVQPMDAKDKQANEKNLDAAIRSAMKHNYILCVQVHKIINVE